MRTPVPEPPEPAGRRAGPQTEGGETISTAETPQPGATSRVLIAPVTVTPTKALGLSHLKGLLWVDAMYRATRLLNRADYLYDDTSFHVTRQTAGFWEYLDRTCADIDTDRCTETEVGGLYAAYQRQPEHPSDEALQPYVRAVEESGWVHPVSRRVLRLWRAHRDRLGLVDPEITGPRVPRFGFEETVEHLAARGFCLDTRPDGGPVYLDATALGLPLRGIASPAGHPNYLACTLRGLLPLLPAYDELVLVHDRELTEDHVLLQKVCSALGTVTHRVAVDRVPLDGVVRSSRHGVDPAHTVAHLVDDLHGTAPEDAVRLGVRLYFIAGLGKGAGQSFRTDLLRASVDRARRILERADPEVAESPEAFLRRHTGGRDWVDPYRLTSALLSRHRPVPARALVPDVYG
ncbi:hypothetical protein N566_02745 [Streptomycetaceae bacterium MP113-05]|nr:hypothetical protein N566_02745 [Streptomycetaceae bacterium MP113-05]